LGIKDVKTWAAVGLACFAFAADFSGTFSSELFFFLRGGGLGAWSFAFFFWGVDRFLLLFCVLVPSQTGQNVNTIASIE